MSEHDDTEANALAEERAQQAQALRNRAEQLRQEADNGAG